MMISFICVASFAIFGVFPLFALSPPPMSEYLTEIKCEITNSRNPQWPKFDNIGRTDLLGYFDVTSAFDTDGEYGHYMLAIAAKYEFLSWTPSFNKRVIEDIKIVASNNRFTPCPYGYWRSCGWDVDSGVGTDGEGGHYDVSLCVLTSRTCLKGQEYVKDIVLRASNKSSPPKTPSGYKRIGWWDVAGDSFAFDDGSRGHYMMGMYVKKGKSS